MLSKFRLILHPYQRPDAPMVIRPYGTEADAMKDFNSFVLADDSVTQVLDTMILSFDCRALILVLEELSDETHTYHTIRVEPITPSV